MNQLVLLRLPRLSGPVKLRGVQGRRREGLHDVVRSVHGASYTRLYNADLLAMVKEFATDFTPPQRGMNGGTGLYCGEQDLFIFLIDCDPVNKQLNDKERVAAALENPALVEVVEKCLSTAVNRREIDAAVSPLT